MPKTAAYMEHKRPLMALSDVELVRKLYDFAGDVIPNEVERDDMYWLLGEAVERWAPTAAWLERAQELRENGLEDEIEYTRRAWLETMSERWQLAEETA